MISLSLYSYPIILSCSLKYCLSLYSSIEFSLYCFWFLQRRDCIYYLVYSEIPWLSLKSIMMRFQFTFRVFSISYPISSLRFVFAKPSCIIEQLSLSELKNFIKGSLLFTYSRLLLRLKYLMVLFCFMISLSLSMLNGPRLFSSKYIVYKVQFLYRDEKSSVTCSSYNCFLLTTSYMMDSFLHKLLKRILYCTVYRVRLFNEMKF